MGYSDLSQLFKDIGAHVKKIKDIDLTNDVLDLQGKMIELFTENQELKQKLADLQENDELAKNIVFQDGAYYNKETGEGPFCSSCWESNNKLIHLIRHVHGIELSQCPQCKNRYMIQSDEKYKY